MTKFWLIIIKKYFNLILICLTLISSALVPVNCWLGCNQESNRNFIFMLPWCKFLLSSYALQNKLWTFSYKSSSKPLPNLHNVFTAKDNFKEEHVLFVSFDQILEKSLYFKIQKSFKNWVTLKIFLKAFLVETEFPFVAEKIDYNLNLIIG